MTLLIAPRLRGRVLVIAAVLAVGVAGCGSSSSSSKPSAGGSASGSGAQVDPNAPEVNPAGDIPDDQVFVAYSPPKAAYSVKVPEGWARTAAGGAVTFTDKLNSVRMEAAAAPAPLSTSAAKQTTVPKLTETVPGFKLDGVTTVSRSAGKATLITYLATSAPDPVTGKTITDAVERYVFFHNGQNVVLTLAGPKGADNVDPWKIVSDSLRYSG